MTETAPRGRALRLRLVETFAALNLAFLSFDVFLAHTANDFANWAEWIPIPFAVTALALAPGIAGSPRSKLARWSGAIVGGCAIGVGLAGMLLHLNDSFFDKVTLRSLVYTAPFVAPLSYVGVGLLLWLNRLEGEQRDWGRWVLLLAWGGFLGNLALSLLDHAQNGFFDAAEWVSVGAAAIGVGFLLVLLFVPRDRTMQWAGGCVLVFEATVGVVGAALHLSADIAGPGDTLWENLLFGAPIFAPLLFSNLALLAALGLWDISLVPAPESAAPVSAAPSATENAVRAD